MHGKQKIYKRIQNVHNNCLRILRESMERTLPVAGNVGIFCQSVEEFDELSKLARELTVPSNNPMQKYFALKKPITLSSHGNETYTYTFLYIRKPSIDSPEAGDIDFVMTKLEFEQLKQDVKGKKVPNATIYQRPGWDMVEIKKDGIDGVAYISMIEMAEKVRFRF